MTKSDIKSLSYGELNAYIDNLGEKKFRARQLYEWMHVHLAGDYDAMTNLPQSLRTRLEQETQLTHLEAVKVLTSKLDGTQKYLFCLPDDNVIESVLMKYHHGNSVCISSQVGCRMGCRFCASTLLGLKRNLTTAEMLEQIYQIRKLSGERVSNIVVMGTGEPLDNYDNLIRFLDMISDEHGQNISQRNITVSTCGLVPQIIELADRKLQITLAISLHAVTDEKRRKLMPIANRYSICEILEACDVYYEKTGRRISFEYSLIAGENDTEEDADGLVRLLHGKNCHINLIPVNPIKERKFHQSEKKGIDKFRNKLENKGMNVTIRREMGRDISGACGQLRQSYIEDRDKT